MAKHPYTVQFTPAALRQLNHLDPHIRRKVFAGIEALRADPRPSGVRKLETTEALYRIDIGPGKNYRAIYQIEDDILLVLVVKVGDRKDVYRRIG